MGSFRLILKPMRFELLAMIGASIAVLAAAMYVMVDIGRLGDMTTCLRQQDAFQDIYSAGCNAKLETFLRLRHGEAQQVMDFMRLLPLVVGIVLGVPVVGREIEAGTAPLAWSLAGSRERWLAGRLLRVALVVVVILIPIAVVSDVLESRLEPTLSVGASFVDWGSRGFPLIAYGLIALAIAVAAGALVGRTLPAILLAGLLCLLLYQGAHPLMRRALRPQAVDLSANYLTLPPAEAQELANAALSFGVVAYDPDGNPIDDLSAWIEAHQADMQQGRVPTTIPIGLPGSRYLEVELLESGALLAGALFASIVAGVITRRRAPY